MKEQPDQIAANFPLIAFTHVLDLVCNVFDVGFDETAAPQQFTGAPGPLQEVPVVQSGQSSLSIHALSAVTRAWRARAAQSARGRWGRWLGHRSVRWWIGRRSR